MFDSKALVRTTATGADGIGTFKPDCLCSLGACRSGKTQQKPFATTGPKEMPFEGAACSSAPIFPLRNIPRQQVLRCPLSGNGLPRHSSQLGPLVATPGFAQVDGVLGAADRKAATKINDKIYQASGFGNTFMVLTDAGNVIIDTSLRDMAEKHHKILRQVSDGADSLYHPHARARRSRDRGRFMEGA